MSKNDITKTISEKNINEINELKIAYEQLLSQIKH